MEQYIDKSALAAEVERLKYSLSPNFYEYDYDAAKVELLEKIEKFLDTLEVKEVDLDKEIREYLSTYWPKEKELHPFLGHMAKYFFNLGLKAQKGEEYDRH